MNIIVLHGDNTYQSYKRLSVFIDEAKNRSWSVVKIDKYDKNLSTKARTSDLFTQRLFIVYGIKILSDKDKKWIHDDSVETEGTLIVYEKGLLNKTNQKYLPNDAKYEKFELPKIIFKFLESFYPSNSKECLKYLKMVTDTSPVEFIFSLLSSHIRDLYWVKEEPSKIPYPSWRVSKLEIQADKFTKSHIKDIIGKLSDIDIKVKTSKTTLIESLDLLILRELE